MGYIRLVTPSNMADVIGFSTYVNGLSKESIELSCDYPGPRAKSENNLRNLWDQNRTGQENRKKRWMDGVSLVVVVLWYSLPCVRDAEFQIWLMSCVIFSAPKRGEFVNKMTS